MSPGRIKKRAAHSANFLWGLICTDEPPLERALTLWLSWLFWRQIKIILAKKTCSKMAERSQGIPHVSEVRATARTGFCQSSSSNPDTTTEKLYRLFIWNWLYRRRWQWCACGDGPKARPWSIPNGRSGNSREIAIIDLHAFDFES